MSEAGERVRAFYAERDRRTIQYGGVSDALDRPVHIVVSPGVANTRSGQIAALALVNLVARVHRHLHLEIPPAPLVARSLLPATDLHTAVVDTALAINPVLDLTTTGPRTECAHGIIVGIGRSASDPHLHLGWSGGRGALSTTPLTDESMGGESVFGASTAAVLAAAALFRLSHQLPVRPARLNPIDLSVGDAASVRDHTTPLDVGTVLVVGAGAVTSSLLYWARELGIIGSWDVVDADYAELHNTNRCMTMTAADAGWPLGIPSIAPAAKADVAARAVNAKGHLEWYDQWISRNSDSRHDLVLPLANGRGVRTLVAHRCEPVLLHATTSSNWTAELHRHRPDRDDCPACRLPDTEQPRLVCSTGPVDPATIGSRDAALPFLSAAAGLLLASAITDIPRTAAFHDRINHWQLDLTLNTRLLSRREHPAKDGCQHIQQPEVRRLARAPDSRRWDYLDNVSAGSARRR